MSFLSALPVGVQLLGGVPAGMVPLVLQEALKLHPQLIHIAVDEVELERVEAGLRLFAPQVEIVVFPAWDCLPYDRVSPSAAVVSQRLAALYRLLQPCATPRVILTTVAAALMKVIPQETLRQTGFIIEQNKPCHGDALQSYLVQNGYLRVDTVREAGEFARRGGIFDLFPPALAQPVRLDFFGDVVESIRTFDAATQRTTGTLTEVKLLPVAEFMLTPDTINHFKQSYREQFGAVLEDDPLYLAVSENRRHGGMEHWLPLYHPQGLDTLFDYAPTAALTLEQQAEDAIISRHAQVLDFYQARQEMQVIDRKAQSPQYKPIAPESFYLDPIAWRRLRDLRPCLLLSLFVQPDGVDLGGRAGRNFADVRAAAQGNLLDALVEHIAALRVQKKEVLLAGYSAGSRDRLVHMLKEHGEEAAEVETIIWPLDHGFVGRSLAVITEADIFGERLVRAPKKRRKAANFIAEASALNHGDFVVHIEHGVGRYDGLETLTVGAAPHDCLRLIYEGGDKLYVPVENIDVLTRYGDAGSDATLDKLGGTAWQGRKARVKKKLLDMAAALLKIAAERQLRTAEPILPPEGLFEEFCARFPYAETEDQLRAIEEVLEDLAAGRPMDRLVCGDVGFGKTEVAMRAAFVVAAMGLQVAIIAPTTLLARQHYKNFRERYQGLPLRLGSLSRLISPKEAALTKKELEEGTLDIVIGTHALLAKGLTFKRLGLVIVDEEQHFGVKQKERMKELRSEVHVLTLTATPIPRTLQLALAGVREMSLITTPPVDRLAVRSYVLPYDAVVLKDALMREHFRGGQSFYVCPRIEDLDKIAARLRDLVPDLKFAIAHGQIGAEALEQVMSDFDAGKFDILLATNIVESGIDIPNANTMIIHRADLFGLAQLYQLRGRVGRGKLRGYAYLTYAQGMVLNETAKRRLEVMGTLDSLGAGFTLASHDMDIRGGGNLLGDQQSGHIKEVGVELYQHMLEEAVQELKAGGSMVQESRDWQPQINLGVPVLIPETYVPELAVRLGLYRRLGDLQSKAEVDAFATELVDRFGKLPDEVENLLVVMSIKQLCRQAHVARFDAGPKGAVITFHNNTHPNPQNLVGYLAKQGAAMKLRPDHKLVAMRAWDEPELRLKGATNLLKNLAILVK